MGKFIQISSQITINVTPGLWNINATNLRSPVADRLSIKPAWTRLSVLVKPTKLWYPAEIKDWDSVKQYVKDNLMVIGVESDTCPNQSVVEEERNQIIHAIEKFEADVQRTEQILGHDKELAKNIAEDTYNTATKKKTGTRKKKVVSVEEEELPTQEPTME